MLFPVLVLFKNQNNNDTTITVTTIVITWVDFIVNPSLKPVISLNSFAFRINLSPSKNLLSKGPIIITVIVVSILFWFLNKTKTGKSMRAYSDNEDLALLSGIDPNRVVMITWMIAGALATIGGVLYGLDKSFKPFVYFNNMLPIFAAAIVGGIGNPFGAFLGGYVIAFAEIFITYAYKKFFMYLLPESLEPDSLMQLLSTDYKFAVSFSILVIVLLFRPTGIFKGKVLWSNMQMLLPLMR